ncbi:MAG: peptidylprolyl isomerase, partial [Streptosporangiaceae bacterium]
MSIALPRPLAAAALALACALALPAQQAAQQKAAPNPAPPKAVAAPAKLGPGVYATFETSKGKFVAQLFAKDAPQTVATFIGLAQGTKPYKDPLMGNISMAKLYDGLLFFRTIRDYMIQTGDPLNNGRGTLGFTIPVEKNNLSFDQAGRMAMAQVPDDPTSRGSQVFFTVQPAPVLDGKGYLIIGQVVEGMDVVKALSEGPRRGGATDLPLYPNVLRHVT